jgi:hypothetical protein
VLATGVVSALDVTVRWYQSRRQTSVLSMFFNPLRTIICGVCDGARFAYYVINFYLNEVAISMNKLVLFSLFLLSTLGASAERRVLDNKRITFVLVNGAQDSPNSGTTCVKIDSGLVDACRGFAAIKNNNQELLSAALHAKATERGVWFYYDDNHGSNHCPGHVFTPCAVISIGLRQTERLLREAQTFLKSPQS